jgi:hypothetical protein
MADDTGPADWRFHHFGLIVTGETEATGLPDLFRPIMPSGKATFAVIRRLGQRSPIRSRKRVLKTVGSGEDIPDKDAEEIGFPHGSS